MFIQQKICIFITNSEKMKNKIYYGEYSLKHWIDLILKRNISLPDYQRSFVWDEEMANRLLETFKSEEFVPPVTIGAFTINDSVENYILDGQQRLTSILLAYLGLYPNKDEFKYTDPLLASDNDEEIEEEDNPANKILKWTFKELTKEKSSREEIRKIAIEPKYNDRDWSVTDDFFENHFLGFSYLVPSVTDKTAQQGYFSSVFRNINIQGKRLHPQESRKSFYFLNDNLSKFFEPDFCDRYTQNKGSLDFVRLISLLSQYHREGNTSILARGYKPKMERYYEEFIYSVVDAKDHPKFCDMSKISNPNTYPERFDSLTQTLIAILGRYKSFTSIIEADTYLFGLIYYVLFSKRQIKIDSKESILEEVEATIKEFKDNHAHTRSPAALKYIKQRVDRSVDIYKNYLEAIRDE